MLENQYILCHMINRRKENKYTQTQKHKQNKEEILMTIILMTVSLAGYMLIASTITTSSTLHSVCLQQVSQLLVVLYLVG